MGVQVQEIDGLWIKKLTKLKKIQAKYATIAIECALRLLHFPL